MTDMKVTPASGSTEDMFTYRIDYYDQSGLNPQEAKVFRVFDRFSGWFYVVSE